MKEKHSAPVRLDYYLSIAEEWTAIFNFFSIRKCIVAELCIGWSPKIILALQRAHFDGSFIALDKSTIALETLRQLLSTITIEFPIEYIQQDILTHTMPSTDAYILNHVCDDVVLFYYLQSRQKDDRDIYSDPYILTRIWKEIFFQVDDSELRLVAKAFASSFSSVRDGARIFISQYVGYQERLFEMTEAKVMTAKFLRFFLEELQLHLWENVIIPEDLFTNHPYFTSEEFFVYQK